jgi:hypothetical protein
LTSHFAAAYYVLAIRKGGMHECVAGIPVARGVGAAADAADVARSADAVAAGEAAAAVAAGEAAAAVEVGEAAEAAEASVFGKY